ncbi:Niemann Pick type C2 protein [Camponotus japonicus]|uniref:Niemann Pick type C2 protein n=2 Tax=Camponotus japonicus TaxID=84547 RepID=W6JGW9_9HYME|nr:Niemann Pick type C2 protein [Camponotus japonicus]
MTRKDVGFSLLCVLCCIISSLAFVFEDCGSEVGKFSDIIISSCDPSEEKCSIIRESEIHVSMKFTPSVDVKNVEAKAFGVLLDVPVPFPLKKPEICKDPDSGVKCPLKKDVEIEYKVTFFVEKATPALSLEIMWEFRNEKDEKITCVKFPAKIK